MPSFRPRRAPRPLERDTLAVALPGGGAIDILRVRDPRARRIRLSVNERGARLTLPRGASLRDGDRFVHQHRDWLLAQLARHPPASAAFGRVDAGPLPLRGERLPLLWREGRFAHVQGTAAGIVVVLPADAGDAVARRALKEFYLAQARCDLGRWLPKYLPTLPRPPASFRLRPLSSLWGSLSPTDALSLDLALVLGRPSAFEYVLVHELCHLVVSNHSRAFWREVEARFGDWRGERDYLHGEGAALKAELKRLVS